MSELLLKHFDLLATAPDGVAGWQIEPAQPSLAVEFHASGTTFSVSVFRQGTLFSIQ